MKIVDGLRRLGGGEPLVEGHAQSDILYVRLGQEGGHRQIDADRGALSAVGGALAAAFGSGPLDGFAEQLREQREAHRADVPRLLRAQQIAGPADLEVLERDLEPGAEVVGFHDRRQPPLRDLAEGAPGFGHQVGVGAHAGAADASAQLVHLRQPQALGAIPE